MDMGDINLNDEELKMVNGREGMNKEENFPRNGEALHTRKTTTAL